MKGSTFLVTGGAGFIGSRLVHRLRKANARVIVLDALTYAGHLENLRPWIDPTPLFLPTFGETIRRVPIVLDDSTWQVSPVFLPWPWHKVGSHRVERIQTPDALGDQIRSVLSTNGLAFVWADILSQTILTTLVAEVDGIFHLAAETHVDRSILSPEPFWRTDLWGTLTLLESLRRVANASKKVPRLLHVSTDEVYGEVLEGAVTEDAPFHPSSPYAAAKAAADRLVTTYVRTYGLPALIVRPSNIFGPYQHPEKFIPQIIIRALQHQPLPIYGDGLQRRTWLYVEDAVDALLFLWEHGVDGEAYNLAGPDELPNLTVAEKVLTLLKRSKDLIQFVEDRPGHDRRYAMQTHKIEALGWQPKTRFDEGLERTVQWYQDHTSWWQTLWKENQEFWNRWYNPRIRTPFP